MKKRPYYNDPDTRAFFEAMDNSKWWETLIGIFLFLCFVPIALIARLFGWRPNDGDDERQDER